MYIRNMDNLRLAYVVSVSDSIYQTCNKQGDNQLPRCLLSQGIDGQTLRGRQRKTWAEVIKSDLQGYGLNTSDALYRVLVLWKSTVRSTHITMQRHTHFEVDSMM